MPSPGLRAANSLPSNGRLRGHERHASVRLLPEWGKQVRRAFGLSLAALLVGESVAVASLVLLLDPSTAPVGTTIRARTAGSGAVSLARGERLPLYLAPVDQAAAVTSPADTRLVGIGDLVVDQNGDGAGTFTVPPLPLGSYSVLIFCEACAPPSGGQAMLGVAELTITANVPRTDADEPKPATALVVLLVLLLLVLMTASLRRLSD